jgi:hypothetical protein
MKRREVDFDKIPEALRALPQWVLWRTMMRHGKPAKMPLQPTGIAAKSNDPSTWRDFREISAYYNPAHGGGIGFVFSPEDPFCGVDLDGCGRRPKRGRNHRPGQGRHPAHRRQPLGARRQRNGWKHQRHDSPERWDAPV